KETLEAAGRLAEEGIDCEVIDVATLKPLDAETILASVSKTGRCVVVHEAARSYGPGAEIAALLQEQLFHALQAPVQRVTGFDCVIRYARQEMAYLADVDSICRAALRTLEQAS